MEHIFTALLNRSQILSGEKMRTCFSCIRELQIQCSLFRKQIHDLPINHLDKWTKRISFAAGYYPIFWGFLLYSAPRNSIFMEVCIYRCHYQCLNTTPNQFLSWDCFSEQWCQLIISTSILMCKPLLYASGICMFLEFSLHLWDLPSRRCSMPVCT